MKIRLSGVVLFFAMTLTHFAILPAKTQTDIPPTKYYLRCLLRSHAQTEYNQIFSRESYWRSLYQFSFPSRIILQAIGIHSVASLPSAYTSLNTGFTISDLVPEILYTKTISKVKP